MRDAAGPDVVLLFDLEFSCWADNAATRWVDVERPPEVLAVGLAAYDLDADQVVSTFASLVRPARHPQLSAYCLDLLRLSQQEVDGAPSLADVIDHLTQWLSPFAAAVPTCSWGADRRFFDADRIRQACVDPFAARPQVNLMERTRTMLGLAETAFLDRDDARSRLGLPPSAQRHDALADALDLAPFCRRLKQWDRASFAVPVA